CPPELHAYFVDHTGQERKRRPRGIQTSKPSPQSGWISNAIWIFHFGRGGFPCVTFQKIPSQRLTAGDEAVMAVRQSERRQEGEGFRAQIAATPADLNPVVIFVVPLFPPAPWPMVDSRRHTGQKRKIGPPPDSAQSASRLHWAVESAINSIVTVGAPLVTLTLPGFERAGGPSPP
ncbi:MAG: hypothetical protein QOH67_4602, partial [Hyphomicrobiales bacterium]|nr:hypothetical protein [Hyphomicrobiales bacterium]